jgi:hypothetical protein
MLVHCIPWSWLPWQECHASDPAADAGADVAAGCGVAGVDAPGMHPAQVMAQAVATAATTAAARPRVTRDVPDMPAWTRRARITRQG